MVTVAVGQFSPTEDISANIEVVRSLATEASRSGASVLVLPEYAAFTAPRFDRRIVENAEELDGPFVGAVSEIARDQRLHVVAGMTESIPEGSRAHNTVVALGPRGDLLTIYRKVHLYDALGVRESEFIEAGEPGTAAVIEVDGIRMGIQTCYDLRFPETTRVLADAGVDAVAVVAQWVPGPAKEDHWTTLARARAIENTVYLAAAGQSAPTGTGHSMVIDPMGVVVSGIGEREGLITAVIDPVRIESVRAGNPVLDARRYRVVAR